MIGSDLSVVSNRKHYGEEFRFDVVDAGTDVIVGTSLLTTHGLIMDQKDEILRKKGPSILQIFRGPLVWKGKRSMKLLLRNEGKGANSSDDVLGRSPRSEKEKSTSDSGKSVVHLYNV